MNFPAPSSGVYLDNICNLYAVDRIKSVDWQRRHVFDPEFSANGKLISIYSETDELLRERTLKRINASADNLTSNMKRLNELLPTAAQAAERLSKTLNKLNLKRKSQ